MKSPITGKKMKLCKQIRAVQYNGVSYLIPYHFYKCEDSGWEFTTYDLDEINTRLVMEQVLEKNKQIKQMQ